MTFRFMESYYLFLSVPVIAYFSFCLMRKRPASLRNPILYTLTLICLILALARPQLGQSTTESRPFSGNLYLAVDISQSMLAEDIAPTRLDFATVFSEKVIKSLPQIKVALFPFTVSGFVQIPLTNDSLTIIESLGTLNPRLVTEQGTDLTLSLEKLFEKIVRTEAEATDKPSLASSTSVLLLSDGESHHPLDESVLKRFANKHIPIDTVGIGTSIGANLVVREAPYLFEGTTIAPFTQSAKRVTTKLEDKNLRRIASLTHGDYYPAQIAMADKLTAKLQRRYGFSGFQNRFRADKEFFPWLLIAAFIILVLQYFTNRWEWIFATFLFLSLEAPLCEAKEVPKTPIQNYNEGLEIIPKGDIKKSAELFNESAENTEDNTLKKKALLGLANQQLRMGDPKHALENYQRAYNITSKDAQFNEEANRRISENISLASRVIKQMQKSQGEGEPEPGEGEQPNSNPKDPKGPQQFTDQNFDQEQKKKIFDLVSEQEWQTQQRLQEGKNRGKPRQKQEKPW